MGHVCLRDSMKGTSREGSFIWNSKRYVKALEMGVCFHRGPCFWGTWRGTLFLGPLREKKSYLEEFLFGFQEVCKNSL
jgi:hypothetical protein